MIVVLAGINNVGTEPGGPEKVEDITQGLQAVLDVCQARHPNARIVTPAIFPRNDRMVKPILTELQGPPAPTDHAPPPTGDPSAERPAAER